MDEMQYIAVCELGEIEEGNRLSIEIDDKPIVIFNVNGEFYAIDQKCTHRHGPLDEGELDGHVVVCPWHGAQFDVRTGKALTLPAVKSLNTYPIRVQDGMIEIGI